MQLGFTEAWSHELRTRKALTSRRAGVLVLVSGTLWPLYLLLCLLAIYCRLYLPCSSYWFLCSWLKMAASKCSFQPQFDFNRDLTNILGMLFHLLGVSIMVSLWLRGSISLGWRWLRGACGIIRNKYRLPGPLRGAVLRVKGWGLDVTHGVSATKILKFVCQWGISGGWGTKF